MTKMRLLAREALKLTKDKAPAIVDERILPEVFDNVAHYVGEIMGKLTTLNGDDQAAVAMVHGIVRDRLIKEIIDQLEKDMRADLDKRLNNFSKLSTKKK